jgi:ketosteroid isomerase-like protein
MNGHITAISVALTLGLASIPAPVAAQKSVYTQQSDATAKIGEAYIDAYIALDWDRIEPLIADNATFHDPTAEMPFKVSQKDGKPDIMKGFREGYAGVTKMMLHRTRTLYSGNYAIFEGDLEFGVKLPDGRIVESRTPFVAILRVEDGKVVEHRDYVDYVPFFKNELASRPAKQAQ